MNFRPSLWLFFCAIVSTTAVAQTPAPAKQEDEFAKKKPETKITEVVTTDSLPAAELVKRATFWFKAENDKYKKTGAGTSGNKAECIVSFPCKPKELNPQIDYTGKVTMKVVIECKDAKYRYTISDIKHVSRSGNADGGSVDNEFPACGSQVMNDIVWKKLRGECMRDANSIVADLKEAMGKEAVEVNKDEW